LILAISALAAPAQDTTGSRLVWRPYRAPSYSTSTPTAGTRDTRAARTAEVTATAYRQVAASQPSDDAKVSDAMQDPFGDKRPGDTSTTEPGTEEGSFLDRVRRELAPAHPKPTGRLPGRDATESTPSTPTPPPTLSIDPPQTTESLAPSADPSYARPTGESAVPRLPAFSPAVVPAVPSRPSASPQATASLQGQTGVCPPRAEFEPISKLSYDTQAAPGVFPHECPLPSDPFQPRAWQTTTFAWTAAGLCHKPLYFEDIQLERYGHSWGPYLQPVISHGHFFATVPILPYLMGVNPPNECLYTLGYYRPGSCAPYMIDPLPLSARAALWEAGIWTGAVALVP